MTIGEIDLPQPKAGEVITRTLFTGVSTGTEMRVLAGKQVGGIFPLIPGYENIGEVFEVGEGVDLVKGARVYTTNHWATAPYTSCFGAHVEYGLFKADELFPVPENIDLLDAVFAKTSAIALHGIQRGRVTAHDKVAVVGLGIIGQLAAQIAKARGATVIAIDRLDDRLEAASEAGIDFTINAAREDVEQTVHKLTGGGVDVAIDVTGVASAVDKTCRLLPIKGWDPEPPYPPSGRLVILGSYTEPVAFSFRPSLFSIEPDIYPSRDCTPVDIRDAMGMIASGTIRPRCIPTTVVSFQEAAQAYMALRNRTALRVVFQWR
ncbi:MAG: zinc-binding dehydrogenase [Methanothrix sp.]|nr:zinc-binding dehydrogenase [Methanothrix sp.]